MITSTTVQPMQPQINWYKRITILIAMLIVVAAAVLLWRSFAGKLGLAAYDPSAWYAFHTSTGDVFFGRVTSMTRDTVTLTRTYYLESYEPEKDSQSSFGNGVKVESVPQKLYNLVPRGSDKFFTTDHTVHIDRHSVVFWERLTDQSDIVKTIKKDLNQ